MKFLRFIRACSVGIQMTLRFYQEDEKSIPGWWMGAKIHITEL